MPIAGPSDKPTIIIAFANPLLLLPKQRSQNFAVGGKGDGFSNAQNDADHQQRNKSVKYARDSRGR